MAVDLVASHIGVSKNETLSCHLGAYFIKLGMNQLVKHIIRTHATNSCSFGQRQRSVMRVSEVFP